jgi:DNA polymerase III alpha subunit (gram-positive type)
MKMMFGTQSKESGLKQILEDSQIISLLNKGVKVKTIAENFGVDKSTIYKRIKKLQEDDESIVQQDKVQSDFNDIFSEDTPAVNLDFVCFDIETTNLTADFSVILCACIKPFGKDAIVFRADDYNKDWSTRRMDDTKLVSAVAKELSKHAVVITHYGSKFDLPYLKAKMAKCGCMPLPPIFSIDTWRIAKNNFKVSSRRLATLCTYFKLGSKSGVEGPLWLEAGMNGSKKAMDDIVEHNIQDVKLLERLAALSFPYLKAISKV